MKKLLALLMATAMLASFAACGGNTSSQSTPAQPESTAAEPGEGGDAPSEPADGGSAQDEMVVGVTSISTAADPILANFQTATSIGNHVYNTLVAYDDNNNVVGEVATSWERPDDTTWVFTIDLDSYIFHNGDPVTIEDVVFSVERCQEIPQAMDKVTGVTSITGEGNTLTITTETPNNGLLYDMTEIVITSKRAVEEAGDNWGTMAVGTGPYKLVSFTASSEAVLERWDDHPSLSPAIRKITFRAIADSTSRYIGIENGDLQFVDAVSGAGDIQRALENSDVNAQIIDTLGMRFLAVNAQMEPFNNALVREALQYAVDRDSIIQLLNGIDKPANTMISGALPANNSSVEVPALDLEKAKELLAEAGYENGFDTTLWIYADSWKSVAELMQATLSAIGVNVTIEQYEIGAFFDLLDAGQHSMLLGSQTASPYAVSSLNMYYSDEFYGSSGNFGFYKNDDAIALINEALAATDPADEIRLSQEVQAVVAQDNPYIPISFTSTCSVMANNLKGVDFRVDSSFSFLDAYFE